MDLAKIRHRQREERERAPARPPLCPHCAAWVVATFIHGDLKRVDLQHRWAPCRGATEPQPLTDWGGREQR